MSSWRAWTWANGVLALLFVFSVIVQVNDPDPWTWMLVYGAAAVVCGLEMKRRTPWWAAGALAAVALIWAMTIAPRVVGRVPFGSMFEEFEMRDLGVEESREMYGLLIIAAWMLAVAVAAFRRRRVSAHR